MTVCGYPVHPVLRAFADSLKAAGNREGRDRRAAQVSIMNAWSIELTGNPKIVDNDTVAPRPRKAGQGREFLGAARREHKLA